MFLLVERGGENSLSFSTTPLDTVVNIIGPGADMPGSRGEGYQLQVTWNPPGKSPPDRAAMHLIRINGENRAWIAETPEKIRLWRPSLDFSLDLEKREGEVRLSNPYEWQNVLRLVFFHLLLPSQGLLLHASGLARDGVAYVFPGPSGAGKTSIVRNSPGMIVLTDETVAVRLPGNGTPPQAYGTPFFGEWGKPGENLAAPLRGLYFPVQDRENFVIPLSPSEILERLLPCVCTYTTRRDLLDKLLDLSIMFAERSPGYALHFRPEPELWQAIDGS